MCVSLLHFFSPMKSSQVRDAQCRLTTSVYTRLANLRLQCLKEPFVMSIPRSSNASRRHRRLRPMPVRMLYLRESLIERLHSNRKRP